MTRSQIEFVEALQRIFDLPHKAREAALRCVVSEYRGQLDQCSDSMPPDLLGRFNGTHAGMSYDDFIWSVTEGSVRVPDRAL